ncbi:MAG: OmpH family outer membrane protein [Flavobacteriaceae bacterium]|nr:OmpH family outer membrane protein [Flavobacteriaceae bacterium]
MKRIALFLSFFCLFGGLSLFSAQKIGVIDTDYLLKSLPEYKEAEARFNQQIKSWQTELESVQNEYEKKKELLENERVLLVGEQLKFREKEVEDLQKKLQKHLKEKFATEGEVNNIRTNMLRPFQDKIWAAIKSVAQKNNLGIILDKNSNSSVLFLDKKYDYTDKVLDILINRKDNKKDVKQIIRRK